jgi:hypothetical protein
VNSVKVSKREVWPIVRKVFPDYAGRKFRVVFTDRVGFYDLNWAGGSRNQYAAVRADGTTGRMPAGDPWNNPVEGKTVDLPAEVLVLCRSFNCGHDDGITIYAHPANAPRWLQA